MAISTFIPELWAARLLEHYTRETLVANLVNRNYEGEIQQYGDTVHINSLEDVTVRDYTPNTDIAAPEQLTTVDQVMTIDHGKYFNFFLDDVDKVQARGDLMDAAMQHAAIQLAEDTESFIVGKIAADGGIKLSGTPSATNVYEEIIKIKTAMDTANVPRTGRHLVVPPSIEGYLLLDNRFVTGSAGEGRLTEGAVARAAGFDIYVSNAVTDKILAFNTDSVTFANQITETVAYRPEAKFADAVKGLNLCGAKVTRPSAVAVYTIG